MHHGPRGYRAWAGRAGVPRLDGQEAAPRRVPEMVEVWTMRIATNTNRGACVLLALGVGITACSDDPSGPECPTSEAEEPAGLMLTWQGDPTSSMTIDWHTRPGDEARSTVCFKEQGANQWASKMEAVQHDWPYGDRQFYRVELTELEAGTEYSFQVGAFAREYRFRTMPADLQERPVVFAAGGDTLHLQHALERTNRAAMEHDVDFVAWGGDLAYADGGSNPDHLMRWSWWLESNQKTLIDDDGRVVPILAGIGNHEVVEGYHFRHDDYEATDAGREAIAPYYYRFFAFPGQPGYATMDFGDYMTLVFLDTDHTNPIEGTQTEWLTSVLEDRSREGTPHVFPIYHVPAHPSHRDPDGEVETRVRDTWVPLFEAHDLELVFENHDHTYKRTHPIREGAIDEENGVVYLGDGAWGVLTRVGDHQDEWYMREFASEQHAIIVSLEPEARHVRVVNGDGETIDELDQSL